MAQEKFGKIGRSRAMVADIASEMAKSRMTESVRQATAGTRRPPIQEVKKAIGAEVHKPAKQASDRRLDEEAVSRMDDEGGAAAAHLKVVRRSASRQS
jgi:hypothetical protein